MGKVLVRTALPLAAGVWSQAVIFLLFCDVVVWGEGLLRKVLSFSSQEMKVLSIQNVMRAKR